MSRQRHLSHMVFLLGLQLYVLPAMAELGENPEGRDKKGETNQPLSPEEQEKKRQQAEDALRDAEASLKEAEAKRQEAVAQLKDMGSDRPWAKEVSEEDQQKANAILQEGNALLRESFFSQAIEKYAESLKYWDHPGTHYNIALALLTLDDPLTTHHHLTKAIEHGPEPLEQDKYDYAMNYLALLNKQVTTLVISCEEPGAEVRLDGKFLFKAPSSSTVLVLRDEHSVAATKPGFEPTRISKRMDSNEPINILLKLYRPEELYVYSRPYPLWIPISVTAAGIVITGAAGFATYYSQNRYDEFDQAVLDDPGCQFGCEPNDDAQKYRDVGDAFRLGSWIGYGVGGALIATGVTLWVLDAEQSQRVTPEERQNLTLIPNIGPQHAGIVATGHF